LTGGNVSQAQLDIMLSNIQQMGKDLQSVPAAVP
jgi:hypothetical protein